MKGMKLRFLAMGAIISILSLALITVRGAGLAYEGLFAVGILVLVVGVLWK